MDISGRISKIKHTKNNIFITLCNQETVQLVVKPALFSLVAELGIGEGDIITAEAEEDKGNVGRFRCEAPSYLARTLSVVSKRVCPPPMKISVSRLRDYAQSKSRVRQFLNEHGYIEVNIPVLTDGETSSKAHSYETQHSRTGKKLFLRKTMDSFLRMYSCCDVSKIYSIGPCFRNEYVTAMNLSEFEMLSVFTNYMSQQQAVQLATTLVQLILNQSVTFTCCSAADYPSLPERDSFCILSDFHDSQNSYACVEADGSTNEFKIKLKGVTVVHGVMEIRNYQQYKQKIAVQGKKKHYGELVHLDQALQSGAPLCFNLGISILRLLAVYNNCRIRDYDPFAFSRIDIFHDRKELEK